MNGEIEMGDHPVGRTMYEDLKAIRDRVVAVLEAVDTALYRYEQDDYPDDGC